MTHVRPRLALLALAALSLLPFSLAAQTSAPPDAAKYCGEYLLPSGRAVSIAWVSLYGEPARLFFADWETMRYGELKADGADRFWGPSATGSQERRTEVAFTEFRYGHAMALTIAETGEGAPRKAVLANAYAERDAAFANGAVELAGSLKMPQTGGNHPGIVLIHGSGPGTRLGLEMPARFFARLGFAVLTYDKRGCGASGGDWKASSLDDLADDAAAGAAWLAGQPGLDPGRVGVWGISQGGWVGPLAASRSPNIKFVINHSGPGTSIRRQDLFMLGNVLRARDLPAAAVESVLAAYGTLYDFGRGKATAEALDTAMDGLRADPATRELAQPPAKEIVPAEMYKRQAMGDPAWFFHLDPDYDPVPVYRKLTCPLLVVYGKLDYTVPVDESVRLIEAAVKEPGGGDVTIRVLDGAGHGIIRMDAASPMKPKVPMELVREYYDLLTGWLEARGLAGRSK